MAYSLHTTCSPMHGPLSNALLCCALLCCFLLRMPAELLQHPKAVQVLGHHQVS